MTLRIADTNEFRDIDVDEYAEENPALIARAHNTYRADKIWDKTAGAANANPKIRFLAAYQYLTQSADPAAAARAFAQAIGPYHLDLVILDLEEGTGDQTGRQHAWLDTITGHPEWTYSGDYFARAHLKNPDGSIGVDWLAAYQNNKPTTAHKLWQNTDKGVFRGIAEPCDGSIFEGSIDDLLALVGVSPTHPPMEDAMQFHYARISNSPEVFLVNLACAPRSVKLFADAEYWAEQEGHTIKLVGGDTLGADDNNQKRQGQIFDVNDTKALKLFGFVK